MPFNSSFLQPFSNLQVKVAAYVRGTTKFAITYIVIAERMDSIDIGVTYFRGFVDPQEALQERRMQQEEE